MMGPDATVSRRVAKDAAKPTTKLQAAKIFRNNAKTELKHQVIKTSLVTAFHHAKKNVAQMTKKIQVL